jgi:hypothetical protein
VSLNKIHSDMAKPREVELRGTAADLTREGLDMMQGTRTRREAHTKVPAVAAMARPSLRLGAVLSSRATLRAGAPLPRKGARWCSRNGGAR